MVGAHSLYLGTRCADGGAKISVRVDGGVAVTINLELAGEDVLTRILLGQFLTGRMDQWPFPIQERRDGTFTSISLRSRFQLRGFRVSRQCPRPLWRPIGILSTLKHWRRKGPHGWSTHWVFRAARITMPGRYGFMSCPSPDSNIRPRRLRSAALRNLGIQPRYRLGRLDLSFGSDRRHLPEYRHVFRVTDQCRFDGCLGAGQWLRVDDYGACDGCTGRTYQCYGEHKQHPVRCTGCSAALAGGQDGIWLTDLTAMPRINRGGARLEY